MTRHAHAPKALLVDDDEFSRNAAKLILSSNGFEVSMASSGADALELARKIRFDVAFIDVHMPGMDGYATSSALREQSLCEGAQIIALTGDDAPTDSNARHAYDGFLQKPLAPDALAQFLKPTAKKKARACHARPRGHEAKLDLKHGLKQMSGSWPALAGILQHVEPYIRNFRKNFRAQLKQTDVPECHRLAHSLKGAMLLIGAWEVSKACKGLEQACSEGNLQEAERLFPDLESLLTELADYSSSICTLEAPPLDPQ